MSRFHLRASVLFATAWLTLGAAPAARPNTGNSTQRLCDELGTPVTNGEFRDVLAFGDRHGDMAMIANCPDRVFGLDYSESGLTDPRHADLRNYLIREMWQGRRAASLVIRADFVPNETTNPRYPGAFHIEEILTFEPSERRLSEFL